MGFVYPRFVRFAFLLVLTAGCRQILGFDQLAGSDGNPAIDDGGNPITDGASGACEVNDDCDSRVCQSDGACAATTSVAYVVAGGSGTECTKAAPCARIEVAVGTGRPIVKIEGTVADSMSVTIDSAVELYGDRDTVISRSSNGQIFSIKNGPVAMHQLTIANATSSSGTAIRHEGDAALILDRVRLLDNAGRGIDSQSSGELVVDRCIISGNGQGGADIEGKFTITNTLIVKNGATTSPVGGLRVAGAPGSLLQFTTIADNAGVTPNGLVCNGPFPVINTIIVNNTFGTGCTLSNTMVTMGSSTPAGAGNFPGNPSFLSTDGATGPSFYRISLVSQAINHAGPSAVRIDLDGEARPADNGDLGADEVME